jgi:methylmalonyl-CoA epimerase
VLDAIDHTGIAVARLDEAIPFYHDVLGLSVVHREALAEQGVDAAILEVGDSHVELIAPLSAESSVARFLDRHGPGLHHLAYRVRDIDAAIAALRDAGARLIDSQPRIGVRGSRVAFVHPSATGGVLTEIVEPAEP